MSPFEVLYVQKCRTSVTWGIPVDQLTLGLDWLMELEHLVTKVQVNLKEEQDHQKHYTDWKRKDKDFQIGDHVYLKFWSQTKLVEIG